MLHEIKSIKFVTKKYFGYKMEKIPCTNISQKLKSFEDRQNFARELGKLIDIIFRLHIPKRKGF